MKIRSGFVSNSSTSSFIVVGFELDANQFTVKDYLMKLFDADESKINECEDEEEMMELLYDYKDKFPDLYLAMHGDGGASKGKHLIGTLLAGDKDGYLEGASFGFEELIDKADYIKEKLEIEAKTELHFGTRAC